MFSFALLVRVGVNLESLRMSYRYSTILSTTVPVKCKLTVSTRSSKLDSRVLKLETFEFQDARIEDQVSRI